MPSNNTHTSTNANTARPKQTAAPCPAQATKPRRAQASVHPAQAASAPAETRAAWIEAMRLRTLPLAASGSFVAAGIAAAYGCFRPAVFALMFAVSLMLQVISNFADDYGDLAHGLDDETRVGPQRGMQRGIISPAQMKRALTGLCAATFVLGCVLIAVSFSGGPALAGGAVAAMAAFVALGLAAIAAAVFYTVGPHPYGYLGLGDTMSFLFFGVVAVCGGSFLYLHRLAPAAVAAGVALGLPVAAVMNINNMRDSAADAAKGKRTIANRLYARGAAAGPAQGEALMRKYHALLICAALVLFAAALVMLGKGALPTLLGIAITLSSAIPLLKATQGVCSEPDHTKLDRFMAPTSMGTVLLSLAFTLAAALL